MTIRSIVVTAGEHGATIGLPVITQERLLGRYLHEDDVHAIINRLAETHYGTATAGVITRALLEETPS